MGDSLDQRIREAEHYSLIVKNLILQGHLAYEDLLPAIKKAVAKWLDEPEEKIFKKEKEEKN